MKYENRRCRLMLAVGLIFFLPAFAAPALVAQTGSAAARAGGFDVNDLSILLPLGPDGLPYPEIRVDEPNGLDPKTGLSQGQIWPRHLFDQVLAKAAGETGAVSSSDRIEVTDAERVIGNWRVVGIRFIPCVMSRRTITGELIEGFPGCVTQVRLVAQPFVDGRPEDVSVHLAFSLDLVPKFGAAAGKTPFEQFVAAVNPADAGPGKATRLQQAAQMLRQIKLASVQLGADTNGKSMQPHPGLVQELDPPKKDGPRVGALVKTFVQVFTAPRGLTNISYMGLVNPGFEPWVFFGGDVDPPLTARPAPFAETSLIFVPKGGRPTDAQGKGQPSTPAILLSFAGNPKEPMVRPLPADVSTAPLFGENPSESDKAAVFLLDNPGLKHNFNVDCVSCHTTTTRAVQLRIPSQEGDQRLVSPPGISGFVEPKHVPRTRWNLRNFGYFNDRRGTISTRTLTEIIDATQLMNDILAREDSSDRKDPAPVGPGLVCADEKRVWNCSVIEGCANCFAGCVPAAAAAH